MKHKMFMLLLATLFMFAANTGYAGKCTGSKHCTACKNCRYCKHCAKDGGTCGVCHSPKHKVVKK